MADRSPAPLRQYDANLRRQLLLLLTLSTRSSARRPLAATQLVQEVDGYLGQTAGQSAAETWTTADGNKRVRIREKLQEDVTALRALGFGIEFTEDRVGDRRDLGRSYHLDPRPLIPLTLDATHVPDVVRLVAVQRAATVMLSAAALLFSQGVRTGRLVILRRDDVEVEVQPAALVLTARGRWLGIGRVTGTGRTRTFRLGDRWAVEVTSTPVVAVHDVDPVRAIHPLTWGDSEPTELTVYVVHGALARARSLLGPAIVEECQTAAAVTLRLRVTDEALLLARLVCLRTAVTVPDPGLRARLRDHLAGLLEDVPWPTASSALPTLPASEAAVAPAAEMGETPEEPTAGLPLIEARSPAPARVSALTFALALLEQRPQWSAAELASQLNTDPKTLESILTVYAAAESDVANSLAARSAHFSPLNLAYDHNGALATIRLTPEASEGPRSLGRYRVDLDVLLSACTAAIGQLAEQPRRADASSLRAFINAAQQALAMSAEAPPAYDGTVVEDLRRAVQGSERGVYSFDYTNPWTSETRRRTVVPLELRDAAGQLLLDAVDLDLMRGAGSQTPSPAAHTRTFAVNHAFNVRDENEHYPLGNCDLEMYRRYAQQDVQVTLAVDPERHEVALALSRGWGAQVAVEGGTAQAMVTLHPPIEERLFDLVIEHPPSVRILNPQHLQVMAAETAERLLRHHG